MRTELRDLEAVLVRVFEAGWSAGFQEALVPDEHPEEDRCSTAYAEWLIENFPEAG